MSLSHSKTVSSTHCYVYDPTSHEECDIEDSDSVNQQNSRSRVDTMQASPKSDPQMSSNSKRNDRSDRSSNSDLRTTERSGDRNLPSSSKDNGQIRGGDSSSARMQDRSNPERGSSRSKASNDRSNTEREDTLEDLIVLSDDESSAQPPKRRREYRRSKYKGTSRDRNLNKNQGSSDHQIKIRDERSSRWVPPAYRFAESNASNSRTYHSRSPGRRSRSREETRHHRSRSKSIGRRSRHRSKSVERRRDEHRRSVSPPSDRGRQMRAGEMQHLKERIEKLKAEISRTKMQKDDYLRRDDRFRDERNVCTPLPPPPLPTRPPDDRVFPPSDIRRFDGHLTRGVDTVMPQQWDARPYGTTVDISHDRSRDYRSTDNLRDQVPAAASKPLTLSPPRSR